MMNGCEHYAFSNKPIGDIAHSLFMAKLRLANNFLWRNVDGLYFAVFISRDNEEKKKENRYYITKEKTEWKKRVIFFILHDKRRRKIYNLEIRRSKFRKEIKQTGDSDIP